MGAVEKVLELLSEDLYVFRDIVGKDGILLADPFVRRAVKPCDKVLVAVKQLAPPGDGILVAEAVVLPRLPAGALIPLAGPLGKLRPGSLVYVALKRLGQGCPEDLLLLP